MLIFHLTGVMHQIQRLATETCQADSPKKDGGTSQPGAAAGPAGLQPGTSSEIGGQRTPPPTDAVDFLGAVAAEQPTSPTPQM